MPDITQIRGLINQRDNLIAAIIAVLENKIDLAQRSLLDLIVTGLVDGLDKDNDIIKNTQANRNRLLLLERIYNQFAREKGLEVVAAVANGVNKILVFNKEYFDILNEDVPIVPLSNQVKETVQDWLGLTSRNTVAKGGYLDNLVKDPVAKQKIQDLLLNATITQKGFYETRANLKELIQGTEEKAGLIASRYSQVVQDTFSIVDRTTANMYGMKLKLPCAIYAGPIVKDSRVFCLERKQKVFTQREISEFNPTVARPPAYDPFTMLGGYGCLDHLNFINYRIAKSLRPDLPPESECYL